MAKEHRYQLTVTWTGNRGEGTSSYRSYDRDHEVSAEHLSTIAGSSDPHFRGGILSNCSSPRRRNATCCRTCTTRPSTAS
jgi:hypothetical protein